MGRLCGASSPAAGRGRPPLMKPTLAVAASRRQPAAAGRIAKPALAAAAAAAAAQRATPQGRNWDARAAAATKALAAQHWRAIGPPAGRGARSLAGCLSGCAGAAEQQRRQPWPRALTAALAGQARGPQAGRLDGAGGSNTSDGRGSFCAGSTSSGGGGRGGSGGGGGHSRACSVHCPSINNHRQASCPAYHAE